MAHLQPLPLLPDALIGAGYPTAPYRSLYTAAIDRRIPAMRGQNGRWMFSPADLPAIAEALGLAQQRAA